MDDISILYLGVVNVKADVRIRTLQKTPDRIVEEQETIDKKAEINRSILEEVKDYSSLKMLLSRKLNRVL